MTGRLFLFFTGILLASLLEGCFAKVFATTIAAMRLVDQGKLDLDSTVGAKFLQGKQELAPVIQKKG